MQFARHLSSRRSILNLLSRGLDTLSCVLLHVGKPLRTTDKRRAYTNMPFPMRSTDSPDDVFVSFHPVFDGAPHERLLFLR